MFVDISNDVFILSFSEGLTSEARFANTVIAVDAIFADAIVTWVTGTVVKVYLTVCACVDKEGVTTLDLKKSSKHLTMAENMIQF